MISITQITILLCNISLLDFYNILGALIGVLITGGIAIWIFRKGIKEENKRKFLEENKRLDDIENLYFILLQNINKGINRQTELFDEFSKKILTDKTSSFHLPKVINQDLIKIVSLELNDILKIYQKRKISVEKYNKVFSNLNFIIEVNIQIENIYNQYIDKISRYSEIFKIFMNKILTLTSNYLACEKIDNPENFKNNPLYNFIKIQISTYYKDRDKHNNIDYHYDNFIRPLNVGLVENFGMYKETIEITNLCKKANDAKFDYELNIKLLAEQITVFNEDLKDGNKVIEEHLDKYKTSI